MLEGDLKVPEATSNEPQEDSKAPEITGEHIDILDFLKGGQKRTAEVAKRLSCTQKHALKQLKFLMGIGMVIEVKRSHYRLSADLEPRTEGKNQDTINKLLNLYDKVLDKYSNLIETTLANENTELEKKTSLLNNFKALASMVDPLMKRWYLVHRGYDANTRQAQEDAKKKTADREKATLETSPPEDQIVVVREYHESVREILKGLPKVAQEKHKV